MLEASSACAGTLGTSTIGYCPTVFEIFLRIYIRIILLAFQLIEVCLKLYLKFRVIPVFLFICVLVYLLSEMCYLLLEIQVEIVDVIPAPQQTPFELAQVRTPSRSSICSTISHTSMTTSISSSGDFAAIASTLASRYNQLFGCELNK